jgi:hypothetical protein
MVAVAVAVALAVQVAQVESILEEVLSMVEMAVLMAVVVVRPLIVQIPLWLENLAVLARLVLFGPALPVHSHLQTRVICNEFVH